MFPTTALSLSLLASLATRTPEFFINAPFVKQNITINVFFVAKQLHIATG